MTEGRPELVLSAEIARRLNVSRERVRQWAANPRLEFPLPVARVGRSDVWEWPQVALWAERRRDMPAVANWARKHREAGADEGT